ncbi:MAG: peptidase M61 [Bacteroidota bacterium]|nr:peptidase M61 [Bacteroidota bacterium]
MRHILIALFLIFIISTSYSQVTQNDGYQFFTDLNKVEDDRLTIELITPKINSDVVYYRFPAMVPGTYKVYNFGRFVSDLKAFDELGNELSVVYQDVNTWEISDAGKLYKITYKVDDTFEDTTGESVFEPVGTSIDEGKVFVVNNQGFFGYLDDYKNANITITFTKPFGFFGSTSLTAVERTDSYEIFTAPDYYFLVDNPIIFSIPDTTSINFDETKVLISVYSPGKGMTSKDIAEDNKILLPAIRNYLGGKLPADRYSFLYYFSDLEKGSGSFGALEHNYSSLYYMPDVPAAAKSFMIKQLQSTNAHEFYHVVTPLNLHSEEIGNFDFNNPTMSKHLWLYEGVTEFKAHYIRLVEDLITLEDYVEEFQGKLNTSARYNDTLPFTELSKGALDKYESQYANVYEKGALIGMCLDILIRDESNGQQGLQDIINKLLEKYGKERSFKDEDLFGEIGSLTSPKVRTFLDKYVAGPNRIPYNEIFEKVGIAVKKTPYTIVDAGNLSLGFNQQNFRLKIVKIESSGNKFINDLGVKAGDEFISVNGKPINFQNIKNIFGSVKNQMKPGDDFELVVARYDSAGKESQQTLKAKVSNTKTSYEYILKIDKDLSDKQQKLKKVWIGK